MRPSRSPGVWAVAVALAALAGGQIAQADETEQTRRPQIRLELPEPDLAPLSPPPPPQQADAVSDRAKTEKAQADGKADGAARKEEEQEAGWVEVGKDLKLTDNVWADGMRLETADHAFRFHAGGRFDFDNSWYKPDPALPFVLDDGTAFRRARLRADGTLWELLDFAVEVSFANIQDINTETTSVPVGSVGLRDFWLQFKDVPFVGNVRVGHVKAPFGLERTTSSNVWYYMERSPAHEAFENPFEFSNGVTIFNAYLDERVTAAASFTRIGRSTINPFGFDAADGQYGFFGRFTALLVYADEGRTLAHVGVGGYTIALADNQVSTGDRPLVRAGGGNQIPNLLQTGTFFIPDGVSAIDLEGALVFGPFSLSAEYTVVFNPNAFTAFNGVQFSGPRGNAVYHGAYVEAGWFVTPGDFRRYNPKNGTWDRTVPQENAFAVGGESGHVAWGRGAVQLLCRWSFLDLASGDPVITPTSGPRAGQEHDLTLGVAWYLNSQTNLQVNYVFTHLDYVNAPGGDFHGLGCRVHLDF